MFCCTLLYVHSSIAIILMGKRKQVALLNLSSWCLVMVEWLFLAVSWGCLRFVIVVFPDHTRLLFFILHAYFCKLGVLVQWSGRRLQHIDFIWTLDYWARTPDIQNYVFCIKSLNNFQNALSSGFKRCAHLRTGILHFIERKHKFKNISKNFFHPLFQENNILAKLWRCSNYDSTHKDFVKQISKDANLVFC